MKQSGMKLHLLPADEWNEGKRCKCPASLTISLSHFEVSDKSDNTIWHFKQPQADLLQLSQKLVYTVWNKAGNPQNIKKFHLAKIWIFGKLPFATKKKIKSKLDGDK